MRHTIEHLFPAPNRMPSLNRMPSDSHTKIHTAISPRDCNASPPVSLEPHGFYL